MAASGFRVEDLEQECSHCDADLVEKTEKRASQKKTSPKEASPSFSISGLNRSG